MRRQVLKLQAFLVGEGETCAAAVVVAVVAAAVAAAAAAAVAAPAALAKAVRASRTHGAGLTISPLLELRMLLILSLWKILKRCSLL